MVAMLACGCADKTLCRMDVISILTGKIATDRAILEQLEGEVLYKVCRRSKYTRSLCDEEFWARMMGGRYGFAVDEDNESLYRRLYGKAGQELVEIAIELDSAPLMEYVESRERWAVSEDALNKAITSGAERVVRHLVPRIGRVWSDDALFIAIRRRHEGILAYLDSLESPEVSRSGEIVSWLK